MTTHLPLAPAPSLKTALRRFLVIAAIAFWIGGFTFYSGVAVPVGTEILHSHLRQGFITERVTNWLNVAGVAALTILLWNILAVPGRRRWVRVAMLVTWGMMLAIEIELLVLHPIMDRLVDVNAHELVDPERFDLLHHVYLISSTVQWVFGVAHVWCVASE